MKNPARINTKLSKKIGPQSSKTFWLWLFSFLILAQSLVPIQTHTAVAITSSGDVVIVCTLGEHNNMPASDLPSIGQPNIPDEPQSAQTPASLFSSLLGDADLSTSTPDLNYIVFVSHPTDTPLIALPSFSPIRLSAIRAPPIV